MNFNPISPPCAYGTGTPQAMKQGTSTNEMVNIDIDEDDNNGANRPVKERYWSHEEEERLVITYQFSYFVFCKAVFGTILDLFTVSYFAFCKAVFGTILDLFTVSRP
jgi:hypothetical protein